MAAHHRIDEADAYDRRDAQVTADAVEPDAMPPLDVIVVDDDPVSRSALCAAVLSLGHRCRGTGSGMEALSAHAGHRADVIVSDWTMPGMDGMELCRRVRALHASDYTYLLFTSGHADKRDFLDAVRAGADDCLPKPIDLDDLEARLIAARRVVNAYRQLARRNVVLRHDSRMFFRAARIDPLTQVSNRLGLEEDLATLQAEVSRYGSPVAVAKCDLDGFKRYNDCYGHLAGDDALRRIAACIRDSLRRSDHVYRYGGEEFLVVLREQTLSDAEAAMERVRAAVQDLAIQHAPGAPRLRLTVSVGMAPVHPAGDHGVHDAVARADAGLYVAKAAGGNAVRGAPEDETRI